MRGQSKASIILVVKFKCCLSNWDKIRLHTKNQLPVLSGIALNVYVGGGWGGVVGGPTNDLVYPNSG